MDKRLLKNADLLLLGCVVVLAAWGAVMVYSATNANRAMHGLDPTGKLKLQLVWIVLGLVCMGLTAAADYSKLTRFCWPIYVGSLALLVLVLLVGEERRGALRWLQAGPITLQPSELARIAIIIALATVLAQREERRASLTTLGMTLGLVLVPMALVFKQPDLGTPVIAFVIWLVIMFVSGARTRHLVAVTLTGMVAFGVLWGTGVISDAQKERILAFRHPERDPMDSGYHMVQARLAVGAGGLLGKGLFRGPATQNQFIPDQETDFIFTAVGEELGFVGSVVLLAVYFVLLSRASQIATEAKDVLGRLLGAGIATMLFIHVFVSLGMTLGLLPVKGLALPFFSYGGSSMLANMIAVGLLESIYMRRHKITF
ncbi:MAG: rod shape-determining protein RodA [Armatimonadota bacterium]